MGPQVVIVVEKGLLGTGLCPILVVIVVLVGGPILENGTPFGKAKIRLNQRVADTRHPQRPFLVELVPTIKVVLTGLKDDTCPKICLVRVAYD